MSLGLIKPRVKRLLSCVLGDYAAGLAGIGCLLIFNRKGNIYAVSLNKEKLSQSLANTKELASEMSRVMHVPCPAVITELRVVMGACWTWQKGEVCNTELTGLLRPVLRGVHCADQATLPVAQECNPRHPAAAARGGTRAQAELPCRAPASHRGQGPLRYLP